MRITTSTWLFSQPGWLGLALNVFAVLTALAMAAPPRASGAEANARVVKDFPLLRLARSEFPNLTRAETALLVFADLKNRARGEFALAGPSADPNDASNDPRYANEWDGERRIRASLIRWLSVDPDAARMVDPNGVRVLGAQLVGPLDLSHVRVPFAIVLIRCSIPERMNLQSAEIPELDLNGSHVSEIFAPTLNVPGELELGFDNHDYGGFYASGEVDLESAIVGGDLSCGTSHFHHSNVDLSGSRPELNPALDISSVRVGGSVALCCGFESDGGISLMSATIGGDLGLGGGHLRNPGNVALTVLSASISGNVFITNTASLLKQYGKFEANGAVEFAGTRVGGIFWVDHAAFLGAPAERHGLFVNGLQVKGPFGWHNAALENGGVLDLSGASLGAFVDEEKSWPAPGRLLITGLTYGNIAGEPNDAAARLRWLALQPSFTPGSYRQLAKVASENGDEVYARQILIAMQDQRYAAHGPLSVLFGKLLKLTIGYGYRPMLTVLWALAVIALGWLGVAIGKRAGVMRPTWPENSPRAEETYEDLHPLLYSIDVFFPFVNFHQEHYWWPDAHVAAEWSLFGQHDRLQRAHAALLLMGPDRRGMAPERDLPRRHNRPHSQSVTPRPTTNYTIARAITGFQPAADVSG